MPTCFLLRGWGEKEGRQRRAYPGGPDWQTRKCRGGEEPGPPEVPASPCRSAGSLPLAGRRLGGEKARRGEQGRGAEGLEGGVEGGGRRVGGGLKQRAANQPGGIPSSGSQGPWGRARGLAASRLSLTVLRPRPRCLPPSGHPAAGGRYRQLLLPVSSWGRQEPPAAAAPGTGHYSTAGMKGCQGSGGKWLAILPRGCPHGMNPAALTRQGLFIRVGVRGHVTHS